jgi:hypothetical protein
LTRAESGQFPAKCGLLAEAQRYYGKILAYGWVQTFLARHTEEITRRTIRPQENLRFQVPQQFLNDYLDLIRFHITGMNPRLVDNIDETGCSD